MRREERFDGGEVGGRGGGGLGGRAGLPHPERAEDTERHGESDAVAGEGGCLLPALEWLQPLSEPAPGSRAGWHLASAAACCLRALLVLVDH